MSVLLGDTLAAQGRTPQSLVAGRADWGAAALTAAAVRAEGQEIRRLRETGELAHGEVVGAKPSTRRRRLRKVVVDTISPTIPVP